jgi:hypothetical protein
LVFVETIEESGRKGEERGKEKKKSMGKSKRNAHMTS